VKSLVALAVVRESRTVVLLDRTEYLSETRPFIGYTGVADGD